MEAVTTVPKVYFSGGLVRSRRDRAYLNRAPVVEAVVKKNPA